MNMIVCGSDCRYQKDGYCCLEGRAVITNAVSSPCCYYDRKQEHGGGKGKEVPPGISGAKS
ncbi:MAG: hypothetical protein IK093_10865 [Ruminiclostridium sp.]|nr:hypothetical protein [Ruminiclostridium sp.]